MTGVSGSGKSTLVDDILRRALFRHFYNSKDKPGTHKALRGLDQLDKAIVIDQSAIGRTPRSNPITYTGAFTPIRELFSQLPAARVRGYDAGRFSFNVKGGRCENCEGGGLIKIEMHFLPDVYVECEVCHGQRYNRETLEITFKGKNIADVLNLTVDEAARFFRNVPSVSDRLVAMLDVGLGYLRLGQAATTLSGGEAQRVKLATELAKKATGRTIYILDEPTTGLHFADIEKLLQVLMKLRDAGNTLVVIEHNLEMIKCADWIIDLGPEGGERGGEIVGAGTPEKIAEVAGSHTGRYLKPLLTAMKRTPNAQSPTPNVQRKREAWAAIFAAILVFADPDLRGGFSGCDGCGPALWRKECPRWRCCDCERFSRVSSQRKSGGRDGETRGSAARGGGSRRSFEGAARSGFAGSAGDAVLPRASARHSGTLGGGAARFTNKSRPTALRHFVPGRSSDRLRP